MEIFLQKGFPWYPSAVDIALDHGHREVFYWAQEKGLEISWFSDLRLELDY